MYHTWKIAIVMSLLLRNDLVFSLLYDCKNTYISQ